MQNATAIPPAWPGMKDRPISSGHLIKGVGENPGNGPFRDPVVESPLFSFYRHPVSNAYPGSHLTIYEVYRLITGKRYQASTSALRAITDNKQARAFKSGNFDYVTFSGIFTYRNAASLVQHSGLLTIDFDHIQQLDELKQALLNDDRFETVLLFVSPSGNGLKWIIAIDTDQADHQSWFEVVAQCIKESYQLDVDPSGKDTCRACFLCYDPAAFINPAYLPVPLTISLN